MDSVRGVSRHGDVVIVELPQQRLVLSIGEAGRLIGLLTNAINAANDGSHQRIIESSDLGDVTGKQG